MEEKRITDIFSHLFRRHVAPDHVTRPGFASPVVHDVGFRRTRISTTGKNSEAAEVEFGILI
ncbi:hypothetical protein E2C01_044486 [Portunus trituberculatus]|uniref:Uncharacterized protein n=1 Tax=Portunus trituberculatus TaxID=210409 RepID=A0A5B7FZ57_PORTR|nr:hypothetical protein [Portunus trituberculatus]